MSCKLEPLTSGTTTFYKALCGDESSVLKAPSFAPCLSRYIATEEGQKCLKPFGAVDLFTKEGPAALCSRYPCHHFLLLILQNPSYCPS